MRSEGRFLLARERSVQGDRCFQTERIAWTKVVCQKEACQIEGLKSDQCHWNSESDEECARGGCRGKWGPDDPGF